MAVIAVDCGGTSLRAARLTGSPTEIDDVAEVPTPAAASDLAEAMFGLYRDLGEGEAVGVAVAGLVDHASGDLVWMPHIGGGSALGSELARLCGVPVAVDNDANVAALAEAREGAGIGHRMVLMVTVGTGIGGGLVVDGRVERGRAHLGEVGHLPVDAAGPRCSCGRLGCWETLASGRALDAAAAGVVEVEPEGAVARLAAGAEPVGRHLVEAAGAGDGAAAAALLRVATWFGRGLAGLVAVFDPDVIVVGGGVSDVGEPFLGPAIEAMERDLSGAAHRRPTPVVPARFGTRAGIVGAAIMAAGAREVTRG